MNEPEQKSFEAELRRLSPAKLPEDFAEQLTTARLDVGQRPPMPNAPVPRFAQVLRWLRWLAPATIAVAIFVGLVIWLKPTEHKIASQRPAHVSAPATVRADDVEIDRQLVGTFDAVATLPDGEPVRVLCREWMDKVVLRDNKLGVDIQHRAPRFEIIPVGFETF